LATLVANIISAPTRCAYMFTTA